MKPLNIFKPEMFRPNRFDSVDSFVNQANEILNQWLKENGVRVSGRRFEGVWEMNQMMFDQPKPNDTHKALLINIEPIKECEHEPRLDFRSYEYDPNESPIITNCKKCKVQMKAKWEVCE